MDFKDFINQIKELADPAVFAIIAKFAILFYVFKIFFKFIGKLLKIAFDSKEKYEDYLQKGDSIALSLMYTEDAEVLPAVAGREHIKKVFSGMIRDSVIGSFETTHLWGNETLLVEEGKGVWSDKSGKTESKGKYLLVWKKEAGEWKILRDTWFPVK